MLFHVIMFGAIARAFFFFFEVPQGPQNKGKWQKHIFLPLPKELEWKMDEASVALVYLLAAVAHDCKWMSHIVPLAATADCVTSFFVVLLEV